MNDSSSPSCSAFAGYTLLRAGPLAEVALAVKALAEQNAGQPVLVFDDASGRVIDLDLRGTQYEVLERLPARAENDAPAGAQSGRGKGRPKLGVVGREVTLLPRHWEWLAEQPGGASVVLRKLIDEARKNSASSDKKRLAQEAAYRFMHALAGDLPGYEEATRRLFSGDAAGLKEQLAAWPADVRDYALRLANCA